MIAALRERPAHRYCPALKRLQIAACLLSDIGWRAHPDYRGEQTLNVIAHAPFSGVDHAGRAFLSLTAFYRYAGLKGAAPAAEGLRRLLTPRVLERAHVVAAIFRVAYLMSAGMPRHRPARDQPGWCRSDARS